MTDLTPPPELVEQWVQEVYGLEDVPGPARPGKLPLHIATQAARWGADQELEACCEWLKAKEWIHSEFSDELRAARRPKPPSLKEQALAVIENSAICDHLSTEHAAILRRALEQLND